MTCVKVCPYSAPYVNKDHKAQIEAAKCMGCGICVAECPARAIQLNHYMTDQFTVMIKQLFEGKGEFAWKETSAEDYLESESCACITGKAP